MRRSRPSCRVNSAPRLSPSPSAARRSKRFVSLEFSISIGAIGSLLRRRAIPRQRNQRFPPEWPSSDRTQPQTIFSASARP